MKIADLTVVACILALGGCAAPQPRDSSTYDQINAEMAKAADNGKARQAQSDAVSSALLPSLKIEMPRTGKQIEQKFDLVVNNAPVAQVFMGIVSGTRYSMLVHPEVTGTISANLKDVTVLEALEAIHDLYGYDYKLDGQRIFIQPLTLQTRVFLVNYLTGDRKGHSATRVISGSVSDAGGGSSGTAPATSSAQESSKISTTSSNDFWAELKATLTAIVGDKDGRGVVVSPQSGIVTVRAFPNDLRNVEKFLKAAQLSVNRQVMLEAKILEVQLNDSYQSGVNWAAFRTGPNVNASLGVLAPGATLGTTPGTSGSLSSPLLGAAVGSTLVSTATATGTLFGLAFQTGNFAALLSFLETQGDVHVLSSPRIATINNQKAVLKVGTDEFFVTGITTTTAATTPPTITPTITLQPFFSGIALDVTPQIDESGNIILHVHPSVSKVTTDTKTVNLGASAGGVYSLPVAKSSVSETDSIVRVQDGHVVAIGGLMGQSQTDDRSQVPGAGDIPVIGGLFRNTGKVSQKRELVILIKPTVINGTNSWEQDILQSQQRVQALKREPKD